MKATCRNILCKGKPFEIEYGGNKKELNEIQCPHCNHIGVMPENHIVQNPVSFPNLFGILKIISGRKMCGISRI